MPIRQTETGSIDTSSTGIPAISDPWQLAGGSERGALKRWPVGNQKGRQLERTSAFRPVMRQAILVISSPIVANADSSDKTRIKQYADTTLQRPAHFQGRRLAVPKHLVSPPSSMIGEAVGMAASMPTVASSGRSFCVARDGVCYHRCH